MRKSIFAVIGLTLMLSSCAMTKGMDDRSERGYTTTISIHDNIGSSVVTIDLAVDKATEQPVSLKDTENKVESPVDVKDALKETITDSLNTMGADIIKDKVLPTVTDVVKPTDDTKPIVDDVKPPVVEDVKPPVVNTFSEIATKPTYGNPINKKDRAHFRFKKPGSAYGKNIKVYMDDKLVMTVPDGSKRFEPGGGLLWKPVAENGGKLVILGKAGSIYNKCEIKN